MATQVSRDRVWDIIERVRICMLTTRTAVGLRARPVEARPDRDNGVIWFVTDLRSAKEHEIARDGAVGLVFVDARDKAYLSITVKAEVRRDHAKAAEIWKRTDNAWWQGPHDKNVCVLRGGTTRRPTLGRPGEQGARGHRIRAGAACRRKAAARREPQSDGADARATRQAKARHAASPRRARVRHLGHFGVPQGAIWNDNYSFNFRRRCAKVRRRKALSRMNPSASR
jgi:general stress protein 26